MSTVIFNKLNSKTKNEKTIKSTLKMMRKKNTAKTESSKLTILYPNKSRLIVFYSF